MSAPAHSAAHARNYVDPEDEANEKAKKDGEPAHSKGMVSENKEESCLCSCIFWKLKASTEYFVLSSTTAVIYCCR
jgi:hypothetical protein